jgi:hypothetical protein
VTELRLTGDEVANRAELLAGAWDPTIWYFLDAEKGTRNGGRDPTARDCATHWKDGNGKPWATTDCTGLVCWALGIPRKLKRFKQYGGYINTDAAILDADETQSVFVPARRPRRGTVIVMPGKFDENGKRISPGHWGIITGVLVAEFAQSMMNDASFLRLLRVAHASPRNHGKYHQAVGVTDASLWGSRKWRLLELIV